MSITIDRNKNIIVNSGGKAHCTGYVLIERAADAAVAKGIGYIKLGKVTKHVTKATEAPVWKGTRADLTVDSFKAATGWEV